MSFGVFVSFTFSMISLFSAYLLIPSEYMPAFCSEKNGRSLNLSWSYVGVSILHSMKYLTYQMCWVISPIWSDLDWSSPSHVLVEAHPPIHKISFDAWLYHTNCLHWDSRYLPSSHLLVPCCQYLPFHVVSRSEWSLLEDSSIIEWNHRFHSSLSIKCPCFHTTLPCEP